MSIQEFILLCNSHDGDYVDVNILEQANHLLHRCACCIVAHLEDFIKEQSSNSAIDWVICSIHMIVSTHFSDGLRRRGVDSGP